MVCTTVSALEDKQKCVKDLGWQGWSNDGAHPVVQMEMQQKHYWRRPGPKPRLRTTNRLHARLNWRRHGGEIWNMVGYRPHPGRASEVHEQLMGAHDIVQCPLSPRWKASVGFA